MSIVTLRNAIGTILEGLQVSLNFDDVYYEMPTDIVTTPAVAVLTVEGEEAYNGTKSRDLRPNFAVRAMVEKTDSSDQDKAQTDALLTLVDGIMVELRKNTNLTLSGNAHWLLMNRLSGVKVGSIGNVIVFYFDINVEVRGFKTSV